MEKLPYVISPRASNREVPAGEKLTAEQEFQCQIIGGDLIGRLQKFGPPMLPDRVVLGTLQKWEKDPFIVSASNCCQSAAKATAVMTTINQIENTHAPRIDSSSMPAYLHVTPR